MGEPMRPAPIQPIFCPFPLVFVAMPNSCFAAGLPYHRVRRLVACMLASGGERLESVPIS